MFSKTTPTTTTSAILLAISIAILGLSQSVSAVTHDTTIKPTMSMEAAQADFALNLLKLASNESESMVLSPFSIAIALSMAYAGAKNNTKAQMTEVLAKGLDSATVHKYFGELLADMADKSKSYTLESANRLYVQQNFTLKKTFTDIIQSKYAGQLEQVNFEDAIVVAEGINKWVEQQTHDKIKDLISSDSIDHATRLILVNAVYFKGSWEVQFDKKLTKKDAFHVTENQQKEVDMMHIKRHFNYMDNDDVQVLGMPYKNQEAYMYVFLPKKKFGLAAVEKELNGQKLLELIDECFDQEVQVSLPKFKLEQKFELVKVLEKLGMTDAFDNRADFSGISDEPLVISDVIHKAFIEMNEEGTEAAAASAVMMQFKMARRMEYFDANHPFLFVIVKNSTVLFVGRFI